MHCPSFVHLICMLKFFFISVYLGVMYLLPILIQREVHVHGLPPLLYLLSSTFDKNMYCSTLTFSLSREIAEIGMPLMPLSSYTKVTWDADDFVSMRCFSVAMPCYDKSML